MTLAQTITAKGQIIEQYEDQVADMVLTEMARQFLAEYPDAEAWEFTVFESEPDWITWDDFKVIGGTPDVETQQAAWGEFETDHRLDFACDIWSGETYYFMRRRWMAGSDDPIRIDLHEQAAKYTEED